MTPEALLRAALPPLTGTLRIAGLAAPVEVFRDPEGVPHIRAQGGMHDAFLAQGFVHAQDRLFQMELNRRRALGRSAEWLGPAAAEMDALCRRLGMEAACRRDFAALGAEARGMLEAYAAGVNAFLASGAPLPVEYGLLDATPEPWEAWHPIAVMRRQVRDLPVAFRLDDSMAMTPNARLSDHPRVIVGARVSKSGSPPAQPGDLEGLSAPVAPRTSAVDVVINSEIR